MQLPGGVWRDGALCRDFAFRPLNGEVELAIAESGVAQNPPAGVTAVLAAALAEVGGERATPEVVRGLAVGDRQFLVRQLAARLDRDGVWLTSGCVSCGAVFDVYVQQSALPVKAATEGYPFTTVTTARGSHRLRVPNGADQEAIADLDGEEAMVELLRRCAVDGSVPAEPSEEEIFAIDAALEAVAPEVGLGVLAVCPDCGTEQEVAVDPYLCLTQAGSELFAEIHTLASIYHWSEAQSLALPVHRRRLYLKLIDRSRGMMG